MEKTDNRSFSTPIKALENNDGSQLNFKSDPFNSLRYKEYFKSFAKYNKNNGNHRTYLYDIYLQSRDKYQNFFTNITNSVGLRLEGNKNYENLTLTHFKDDYIINTINISKELENNPSGYFKLLKGKELSLRKQLEGETIKLTPIPFKYEGFYENKEERKKMEEIKRSAVFMRRVEYTHFKNIKIKNKNNKEKEKDKEKEKEKKSMNLNHKIFILKGAILIIEDWWKKIKAKRKIRELNEKNNLLKNKSNQSFKSNRIKEESKNHYENNINSYSNNNNKINSNINYKSNSNINKSTEINSNNSDILNKMKESEIYDKVILSGKNINHSVVSEKDSINKNINKKQENKKRKSKNSNISVDIKANNQIKEKILNVINKNNDKKVKNDKKSERIKKNNSLKSNNKEIKRIKTKNNYKDKLDIESIFESKDAEKFNISIISNQSLNKKQNIIK